MQTYRIPMVPGPVKLPQVVLDVYQTNYGSADLEPEFLELHHKTESNLQMILGTKNRIVIQSGEGMLALWSGLKSCLFPGDRVLALQQAFLVMESVTWRYPLVRMWKKYLKACCVVVS